MEVTLFLLAGGIAYVIWHISIYGWHPDYGDNDLDDTDNENPDFPWEEGEYHL